MTNPKPGTFKATHRETGEKFEFRIEEIASTTFGYDSYLYIGEDYYKPKTRHHILKARWGGQEPVLGWDKTDYDMEQVSSMSAWLQDYDLEVFDGQKWVAYDV